MQASDGDGRFAASLSRVRGVLRAGPRWETSRVLTSGAAAAVAVLAITGVVALGTAGSASPRTRDTAATTSPAKPHYLLPIAALIQNGSVPAPTMAGDTGTVGVPKGTAARPTTPVESNPNTSTIATYRGATGTMTPAGIATLALEGGCSAAQAPTATAVAMAESGGSPSAQGDVTLMTAVWDWSAGLWQIRGLRSERGTGALRDSVANQRAGTNASAMYVISSGCANWSPWTTYTRGTYLGYLGVARQAVDYVLAYHQKHGRYPSVAAPDPTAVIPVSSGGVGGGGAAAPAAVSSSAGAKPKARTTKAPATPHASASAAPSTASGRKSTSSSVATPTRSASPTPKKSTSSTPLLPVPLPTLPSLPIVGTLPTCLPIVGC